MTSPPLIAHVIHHLWIGGLENGLINLINRIPADRYRHVIVCMEDYSDFKDRLQRDDVQVIAINKKPGRDIGAKWRLFKVFRELKPDILHSRNLSGLDALLPAYLAGVKHRIHGEHGRDIDDLDGSNKKLQLLRRLHRPLVERYIPLSQDLERYLKEQIGVDSSRITQIYNGVDTDKFKPAPDAKPSLPAKEGFSNEDSVIIGTVGRFQPVKDQMNLAEGFIQLLNNCPDLKQTARLVIVGDGPLRDTVMERLTTAGYADLVWAPGARDDVSNLMQSLDIFVLPSLAEGISNTLLEAMSCGLPVIATAVGGNPELVEDGKTGTLVPAGNSHALAKTLEMYVRGKSLRKSQGQAARLRAEEHFSIAAMVERYVAVYDKLSNT
ncbi:TIGR03088 family PEP-CTERM/XrtA system glycosyltransferase [Sedimenticola selenatireducens]|uniref:TIGR03088 family PEP-CTERM/XrtA system glycosyltransferase n=1 Tax=Sedimenticola selenatireducens TaxID=191960 RepID=A0A558DR75_9GAMM|nr:TIGR03088 family PEP-CTERM/XrtA system glycosyltransferase [Sedimenticola selenatireducens]TVO73591.1 TIGR03088 family PEP-CTERM/XrtA system glycosyltransferase [Sedimenticola selenatireducens]TVT63531.1 MAG: TIGR03088 family PEP-CTERM/XrtA system glycosyltransferase [Sedimenticola selenatireducens]